jgi:hypothetical protein
VYINNAWQAIEIEWQAASMPGANNGYMRLYVNNMLADEFLNLDNDTRTISEVSLGVSDIPAGTTGTVYFDTFDSHRSSHIGLDPNGPTTSPTNTGWINTAANAAVTSGAGDNNGFQTTPTNANSDGGGFAVDTDSGSNTNTTCSDSGKDRHSFYGYNFASIPSGSTIRGIEVRLDMKVDSTNGSPKSCIELSWNGGATWTAAKTTTTFTTSEATYILGSSSDTWGHTWTMSELRNFRVRITNVSSKSTSDFSLDWVPVRISYLPPTPPTNLIFIDEFETGNLSSWNSAATGNGKLSASTASAMFGSYGMQAVITGTTDLYVEDWSPTKETHYSTRFYFDPHSVSIPNGGSFYILSNNDLRILLKNNAGTYQLRADIYKEDTNSWMTGSFINITNSRQLLEVEWKAASSALVHDGYLKFWINDSLVDTRSNVDNDTRVVNYIDLGAMWSIPSGTSGTIYFDAFESRQGSHIGP